MDDNRAQSLPIRRRLPHTPPPSVSKYTVGAPYFVTICVSRAHYGIAAEDAGRTGPLTSAPIAENFIHSIEHRHALGQIIPRIVLVMPDHIHLVASFCEGHDMRRIIGDIKRFHARKDGIVWQRNFFDFRPRDEQQLGEKIDYIRQNPVRKGLCATPDEWPWQRQWDMLLW